MRRIISGIIGVSSTKHNLGIMRYYHRNKWKYSGRVRKLLRCSITAASTSSSCSVSVDVSDNTGFDSDLDSPTEESELEQEKRTVVSLLDHL